MRLGQGERQRHRDQQAGERAGGGARGPRSGSSSAGGPAGRRGRGAGRPAATPPPALSPHRARYFYPCAHSPPPRHLPASRLSPRRPDLHGRAQPGASPRTRSQAPPSPTGHHARHGPQGPQENPVLRARAPQPAGPPSGGDGKGAAPHTPSAPHAPRGALALRALPGLHWPGEWGRRRVPGHLGPGEASGQRVKFAGDSCNFSPRGLGPDSRAGEFPALSV